jgi:hypothetical protein
MWSIQRDDWRKKRATEATEERWLKTIVINQLKINMQRVS